MCRHIWKEQMHSYNWTAYTFCRHLPPVYTFSYYCLSNSITLEFSLSLNQLFFFFLQRETVHT